MGAANPPPPPSNTEGGGLRGEYFVVGNVVFQMCAEFPAQFSGHGAK